MSALITVAAHPVTTALPTASMTVRPLVSAPKLAVAILAGAAPRAAGMVEIRQAVILGMEETAAATAVGEAAIEHRQDHRNHRSAIAGLSPVAVRLS